MQRVLTIACLLLSASGVAVPAAVAVERVPEPLQKIDIENHLGQKVSPSLSFTDHTGRAVTLGDYFDGKRPVLLTLNYFRCTTLCSVQLNELTGALKKLEWTPGDEHFRVVTVSFDPKDTVDIARGKRESYLDELGKGQDADWAFLTGTQDQIDQLTTQLGYKYTWDTETEQYAHAPAIYTLSPDGTISRVLMGLTYEPRDLRFGLIDASKGEVGTVFDKIILSCFHYVSSDGKYTPFAFGVMRLGGLLTLAVLGLFLLFHWRRERRRRDQLAESAS
ncbi:MAG: SCO family protein [Deltaproteobacteria bacterium]|nr:SCO family protein [Deltaproteobacteria bacterium]MCB9788300.1 SCO family protein [Deltaproteobacteria bacterium]